MARVVLILVLMEKCNCAGGGGASVGGAGVTGGDAGAAGAGEPAAGDYGAAMREVGVPGEVAPGRGGGRWGEVDPAPCIPYLASSTLLSPILRLWLQQLT